jgi:osmotically-inducible protein OsmY
MLRMGRVVRTAKALSPVNRTAVALFAWQHRDEIRSWASYASTAVPRLAAGQRDDVWLEARLRARLTTDHRTRDARGLRVAVHDGVARLTGTVDPEVADAAREVALDTDGLRRVRDDLRTPKGTRRHRRSRR